MNRFISLARTAIFATTLLGATAAFADPMPITSFLTTTDPYQNGRLSRNAIPQDFAGDETYPGLNASTIGSLYHYETFTINVGAANYISLFFDNTASLSTLNSFIAAYQTAYYILAPQTSWIGDVGASSYQLGDPSYMDFVAQPFSTVVLVVNAGTAGNGTTIGASNPFTIYAQASTSADLNDLNDIAITRGGLVIPEPSTLLLAPLALLAGLKSRRRREVRADLLAA